MHLSVLSLEQWDRQLGEVTATVKGIPSEIAWEIRLGKE